MSKPRTSGPFAHLARKAEDDTDDDKARAKKARAESDDDKDDADKVEDEDDEKKSSKAKKARAEDDDDDASAEDDDEDDEKAQAARSRERARCAAIFRSQAAGRFPAVAATLAFETNLPAAQAIATLKATAGSIPTEQPKARGGLRELMAAEGVKPVQTAAAEEEKRPGARLLAHANARR